VSNKDELAQYPRRPLCIMWGEREPDGMYVDYRRIVVPDEDDYEDVYNQAILMHRECGDPMPYTDAEAEAGLSPWSPDPVQARAAVR